MKLHDNLGSPRLYSFGQEDYVKFSLYKPRVFNDPLVSLNFEGFDPQICLNESKIYCLPSLIHMKGVTVTSSIES